MMAYLPIQWELTAFPITKQIRLVQLSHGNDVQC